MKLGRYRESNKPVAMSGRSILFGFTKLDSAEIPRSEKESLATAMR